MNSICFMFATAAWLLASGGADHYALTDDLESLQGTWLTVSLIDDGKTLVDEHTAPKDGPITKVAYEGNKWMVKVGDKTVATGTFSIDPSKTPKELDIMDESGTKNEQTKLAIYELNGDTYRYCIGRAGKPRPTEFSSDAGSGRSLGVGKHETPR